MDFTPDARDEAFRSEVRAFIRTQLAEQFPELFNNNQTGDEETFDAAAYDADLPGRIARTLY